MDYLKHLKDNHQNTESWVFDNCHYLVLHGSRAYGIENEDSDIDLYGVTVPPKEYVYPFTEGSSNIYGFDLNFPKFEQFLTDHLPYKNTEMDAQLFNIVKYFRLCADGNPNMIDSLFVPSKNILVMDEVGELIHRHRNLFLSKKCYTTFKGYAYSQLKKAKTKKREGKRAGEVEKYGYDLKFASHIFRLLNEVEQILDHKTIHDITLGKEDLIDIRKGKWEWEKVENEFKARESILDEKYDKSDLPKDSNREELRTILKICLKLHFRKSK